MQGDDAKDHLTQSTSWEGLVELEPALLSRLLATVRSQEKALAAAKKTAGGPAPTGLGKRD